MNTKVAWTVLYQILRAIKDEVSNGIIHVNADGFPMFVRYSYDPRNDSLACASYGTEEDATRDHNPVESFALPHFWEDMARLFVPTVAPQYTGMDSPRMGFVDNGVFVGFRCGR